MLSDNQGAVLFHARLDAEQSISELSRRSRLSEATVKHTLKKLSESGAISSSRIVNVHRLGLIEYDLACSFGVRGKKEREEIISFLRTSSEVTYVLEAGGSYQYLVTICVDSPVAVDAFLQRLGKRFGASFVAADLMVCLGYSLFAPKFLGNGKPSPASLIVRAEGSRVAVDDLDRQILSAETEGVSASSREVARRLGIAHSTVHYRTLKLRESGVLLGCFWILHADQLGFQEYRVLLSLRGLRSEVKKGLYDFCLAHPHCTYLIECLGPWQFGIGVVVPAGAVAADFANQIYDGFGQSVDRLMLLPTFGERKVKVATSSGESTPPPPSPADLPAR